MADDVREALDALAASAEISVGAVSGRRLVDVAERVGPAAEFVAGLHGLEITGPDAAFHHYALDSVAPVIERLVLDAERELAWCPGLFLEDKTYALTCHVRRVPPELAGRGLEEFEALAEPMLEAHVLKFLMGAKAAELLPAVDWHKGRAVQWIRARDSGADRSAGRGRVSRRRPDRRRRVHLAGRRRDRDRRRGAAAHALDRFSTERARGGRPVLPRAP